MSYRGHPYREGRLGRSISTRPGVGSLTSTAALQCSRCPQKGTLNQRARMPPEAIDEKFKQAGWALDPHICPGCRVRASQERKTMSAKPSPDAMRAQASMLTLLQTHFDAAKGRYAKDWSDQKIADDTKLAVSVVTEFREAVFGPIQEPEEIQQLRSDITALETLQRESNAAFAAQIASLRSQVASLSLGKLRRVG